MFTLGGHMGDFVPRGSRHPLRAHFTVKSIKSIAYILNGNCRVGTNHNNCAIKYTRILIGMAQIKQ